MIRVVVVFLLLVQVPAFGQSVIRRYFDKNGTAIDSARSHWFMDERILDNTLHKVSYYTASGLMRSKDVKDSLGTRRFFYHTNGSLKSEIRLESKRGFPESAVLFYPDGKKQGTLSYLGNGEKWLSMPVVQIENYWDSLGTQIVRDGNGVCACFLELEDAEPFQERGNVVNKMKHGLWTGKHSEGESFEENYAEGVLTSGTLHDKDGTMYQYTVVSQFAEPSGGIESFSQYLASTLEYPAKARRLGVEGKVFIEFVIEKDGTISNVRVLRGIGAGCDEEALAIIRGYEKWVPGKQRGKIVRQRFVLPIFFKLQ